MSIYMIVTSDHNLYYYPDNHPYHFKTKVQKNITVARKMEDFFIGSDLTNQGHHQKGKLCIYAPTYAAKLS